MNLSDYELIAAVIEDNKDPEKLGRVKCTAPGELDKNGMSLDLLPWVYPLCMGGYQRFSKPVRGSKIWLIKNKKNYNEYWYLPYFELNSAAKQFVSDNYDDNVEIIMQRSDGGRESYITFDDNNGFVINTGKGRVIVNQNGDVTCTNDGNGTVKVSSGEAYIGNSNEAFEHTVKGDELVKVIKDFCTKLELAAQSLISTDPYGGPAGQKIIQAVEYLSSNISNVKANNASVN